jgi:hypothetical protein
MFSNRIPMEKAALSPFIHSFLSMRFPTEDPSLETRGKYFVTIHGALAWTEGFHTMGCGLVPQGNHLRHCFMYPSAMQTSARYLPPWLG